MGSAAPLQGVAATALAVAAIRAEETARPDRLFADPLAAAFVAASGWSPSRPPGDRRARRAAGLGGGPDRVPRRAARLRLRGRPPAGGPARRGARRPRVPAALAAGVRWFELDTADVLDIKDLVLAEQAAVAGCERIPVRCDLRADWPGALLAAGFEPGQPTVWVAEGVLAYLSQEQVDGVLADLTTLSAPGSRLGLSMASEDPAAAGRASRARSLRRSAAPHDLVGWLAGHGWAAQVTEAREVLRGHGRIPGAGPGPGGAPDDPATRRQARRPARGMLISATRDGPPHPARLASPRRAADAGRP